MSQNFVLMADSASDIPEKLAREMELELVQLSVSIDGGTSVPGNTIDVKDFYADIRSGKTAVTSAANFDDIYNAFDELAAEGNDVLYIAFSSGLSSTASTGMIAAKEISEKYPERKIIVVDSLAASLGYGLLVYLAYELKKEGKTIEEVRDFVENNKLNLCHWFTVDDLFHLKRGGRVSGATALVGTMLAIKPVLHVDDEGHLINVSKARGRKASIQALVAKMEETAIDPSNQTVFISHGDCLEDAEYTAELVRSKMNPKKIMIDYIGPVIGAHSGPGTIALFFLGTKR